MKKIKVSEKEYKILKRLQKNVNKWVNVENGGNQVIVKRNKNTYFTNEETIYQDNFIRANERYLALGKKNKKK